VNAGNRRQGSVVFAQAACTCYYSLLRVPRQCPPWKKTKRRSSNRTSCLFLFHSLLRVPRQCPPWKKTKGLSSNRTSCLFLFDSLLRVPRQCPPWKKTKRRSSNRTSCLYLFDSLLRVRQCPPVAHADTPALCGSSSASRGGMLTAAGV